MARPDDLRANFARVHREVPLPPGWKWAMVGGEPAVEGPGRTDPDEHSWLTWYSNGQWNVRIVPPGYRDDPEYHTKFMSIDTGLTDIVEAAKVLASYVYMGMVSP